MSSALLKNLEDLGLEPDGAFGGKASHLGQLMQARMRVPAGFAISSRAFKQFVDHNKLLGDLEAHLRTFRTTGAIQALASLRQQIRDGHHVPELTTELARHYASLEKGVAAPLVVVRSSATREDSADASYAGQYDSLLNIRGLEALFEAVKACWASYFSDRAVQYRLERGLDRPGFEMGVVVQRMLEPHVSGVLFTVNPLTGARHELLVEAGFGLGEAFVSGQLSPDSYYLSRHRLALWGPKVSVAQRRISHKPQAMKAVPLGSGNLSMVPIPIEKQDVAAVSDEALVQLGELGLRVERLFKAPQDIEWALDEAGRLFLLQARPITNLTPRPYRRREAVLWTQRFSGERWTEPATNLGWSMIQPILHHFIYFETAAQRYLSGSPPTRVIRGYPYFNITIFRHLVWKFPGYLPPQFVLELFPRDEQEELLSVPYLIPDLGLIACVLRQVVAERRWRRYHWNFLTNHRAWDRFLPELLRAIEGLPDLPESPEEARASVCIGQEWIREYVKIHLLSLLFANLYYQLLAHLLHRWIGDGSDRMLSELMAEPGRNKTVETNLALWELAQQARSYPEVTRCLQDQAWGEGLEHLRQVAGGLEFMEVLEAFLRRYGHRSVASWEIFSPRWCDEPSLVLGMIRGYLLSGQKDPHETEAQRVLARYISEERVRSSLPWWRPWRRLLLSHVLESTQKYMILRENQRFYFDQLLLKVRRSCDRLADLWTQAGLLREPEELTLLTLPEVDQVLAGALSGDRLTRLLARRREAYDRDLAAQHPVFVEGDGSELPSVEACGRTLAGLGISPGRITGPVRVIRELRDMGKLRRGDILVTRATDPGWTPLFLTAAGLITELGGVLSHGAVVAREYNLPAVVNISDATRLLKDDQQITLDGSRGVIYLH